MATNRYSSAGNFIWYFLVRKSSNTFDGWKLFLDIENSSVNGTEYIDDDDDSCSTLYDYDSEIGEISDSASSTQVDSGRESIVYSTESWRSSSFLLKGTEDDVSYLLQGEEKKAYLTAREIATSEQVFVDCLHLICIDFRNFVSDSIPETDLNKILSYLPHLQNLNEDLLGDFENRIDNWMTLPTIADVFLRKGPFLKLYSAYINDFQSQSALLDECVLKYPKFAEALKGFEMSDRCRGLSLKHHIIKPIQRLPQYRLLLDVYLRHLNEASLDYKNTVAALKIVSEVAEHANSSMKQGVNMKYFDPIKLIKNDA